MPSAPETRGSAAAALEVELVTPERPVLKTRSAGVVLPAYEGEMGVLPGHISFLVQLAPGQARLEPAPEETGGGATRLLAVSGGFAEVGPERVSIFAETAEMAEEIDAERARQSLEKAKAEASASTGLDPLALAQAEAAMRFAQVRLKVAELKRRPRK